MNSSGILSRTVTISKSRFPITLWPSVPLSPVLVERHPLIREQGGRLNWRGPHPDHQPRELPDEWVLRQLADTDLGDDDAVTALLEEYGVISWPYFDHTRVPHERLLLFAPRSPEETDLDWWRQRSDGTVEDARWWLKTARALAGAWAEASAGRSAVAAWTDEGFVGFDDRDDGWSQFTYALNLGLSEFRAHVEFRVDTPYGDVIHGLPRIGLFSAACRQIFNFVVAGDTARRCENPTCGPMHGSPGGEPRRFVHQLGGAKEGQYRSRGVRFCTPECARAETQRKYRRRKAALSKEKEQ